MGASIVSGVYAPPVLEPSGHVLDAMSLAIVNGGAKVGHRAE